MNFELRHLITCMKVHEFHHKICKTKKFHESDVQCVLREALQSLPYIGKNRTGSLISYRKEDYALILSFSLVIYHW